MKPEYAGSSQRRRPIRILHLYKDYPPVRGGIEGHLKTLAEGQVRHGHDVTVLVVDPGGRSRETVEGGVRVVRAGRWATAASTPLSPALWLYLRRLEADVTHLQFPYPFGEVGQLLFGRSPTTVLTYQSDIVRQQILGRLYRPFLRRLLRRVDAIVTTSDAYRQSSTVLRDFREKCEVIPLGIETETFSSADATSVRRLRERFGTPLVLFVGRLRYYKGLEVLIEAMERVPATLVVVGHGALAERCRARAALGTARQRVHFVGEIDDSGLAAYYHAADTVVLPSTERSEAFGVVLVEAMAAGTPVISTELGTGTSFVNRHGESGLVVAAGSTEALAEAVNLLLADDDLRRRLGENARRRANGHFHAGPMVEKTLRLYERLRSTED